MPISAGGQENVVVYRVVNSVSRGWFYDFPQSFAGITPALAERYTVRLIIFC